MRPAACRRRTSFHFRWALRRTFFRSYHCIYRPRRIYINTSNNNTLNYFTEGDFDHQPSDTDDHDNRMGIATEKDGYGPAPPANPDPKVADFVFLEAAE